MGQSASCMDRKVANKHIRRIEYDMKSHTRTLFQGRASPGHDSAWTERVLIPMLRARGYTVKTDEYKGELYYTVTTYDE